MKWFLFLGSLNMLTAVALGAFGAHGLKNRLTPEMLAVWQTAVQYHLAHALGLILVGILCQMLPDDALLRISGVTLQSGILLFSGSLYLLATTGIRSLGMITPIGGVAFLAGWAMLALVAMRQG